MKVQNHYNKVINSINRGNERARGAKDSLSPGNPNSPPGRIAQKQNKAQEKAMGIVKRAFAGERKIDDNITKHKMRIASLEGDIRRNNEEIKRINEKQKDLQELVGIGYNDKEQKDLRLMIKQNKTEEEEKYVGKLVSNGLSAYQQQWMDIEDEKYIYKSSNAYLVEGINIENDNIKNIMEERKKHQPMKDAAEEAAEILEASSKEVKEMLLQDIKEDIDKESREFREKLAEKQAKEQKERADSIREANEAPKSNLQDKINEDVKLMLEEMNLIDEDIKGALVDASY
ncbi:MAG: hypothetical protein FWG91_01945 [Lachnospiraceae bacterium]|nr:hypothetical protein [Lachnospiraceae bacterium]